MQQNPNKLSQFWQELKRRKVIQVMTVYVASAFGLLELIDIISGPLDLPGWTIKAAMILAVICLPIAFLLSWFFPKLTASPIPQGFLHSDAKAELDIQDIELQPDEMLPDQFTPSGTIAKKSTGRLRAPFLVGISLTVIASAVLLFLFLGGQSVPLKESDWIVIADFENQTGEEIFDKSLNTAFALSIHQSRHINVLSRERMQETLKLMKVENLENIDEQTGKEIALREGANVYMVPGISRVGSQYILTVRIQDAVSGNTLDSEVVYAEGQDEILGKLDVLIKKIRHNLGESRFKISGRDKPLAKVTTSSLDALKEYSLGAYYKLWMDFEQAVVHYENAIRIDSGFTIAKVALGTLLYEWYDKDEGRKWLEEAILTIDDLTDYEKYNVLVNYALYVENNLNKGIDYAKARIKLYPHSPVLHQNLGYYYQLQGTYEKAVPAYKKALRINPNLTMAYANLIWTYLHNLGQMDSALIWAKQMIEYKPEHAWGYCYKGSAFVGKDNLKEAEYAFFKAKDLEPTAIWGLFRLAYVYRLQGKYYEAIELLKEILTQYPEEIDAYYDLGVLYNMLGDQNNAREHFLAYKDSCENWMDTSPDDPHSYLYCGIACTRLGNREAGWELGLEAMKIDSTDYIAFAEFYAVQGSIEEALDQLEKALQNGYRDLPWIKLLGNFDALRDEIRYKELINEYFKSD
jgi:tetratricopeptide (TPR) repeat protein